MSLTLFGHSSSALIRINSWLKQYLEDLRQMRIIKSWKSVLTRSFSSTISKGRPLSVWATENICSGNGYHTKTATTQIHQMEVSVVCCWFPVPILVTLKQKLISSLAYKPTVKRVTPSHSSAKGCGGTFGQWSASWWINTMKTYKPVYLKRRGNGLRFLASPSQ